MERVVRKCEERADVVVLGMEGYVWVGWGGGRWRKL